MKFSRGLAALILTLFLHTTLTAEYLYKDKLIFNPDFNKEVNKVGKELFEKTGISLRLVMVRELPNNKNIVEYQQELLKEFNEPTVLLTFSELNSKVDIMANESSLYEYFDKQQVLSPTASAVQAFVIALFYNNGFDSFLEMAGNSGGTIIPLLAGKAKKGEVLGKYSASMFNGYIDIAEQIANSKDVILDSAAGNANKNFITIIKIVFYSFVFYGIFMYIKRKLYIKRQNSESK